MENDKKIYDEVFKNFENDIESKLNLNFVKINYFNDFKN
jgi:hypothetical protein